MTLGSNAGLAGEIVYFGPETVVADGLVCLGSVAAVIAAAGDIRALVLDARSADDFFMACELLRALFDNPGAPRRALDPRRVVALIATADVEAAFSLGRYGIAGVIEEHAIADLEPKLRRILATNPGGNLALPLLAPLRSTRLVARAEGELPTVAIGYRHAPETFAALDHYTGALRRREGESTVFSDAATLVEVMLRENLSVQTHLASKAGAAREGQFIGSFAFYRELRRTRYGRIPDHPSGAIAMDVFIAVDEILHEVLHLLFLANERRAKHVPRHHRIAEEFSVTWWQAQLHRVAFPEWLRERHILEINDDFMLSEENQESREFWRVGHVFEPFAGYPWVDYVLAQLPGRASYIGVRPDLAELCASFEERPEAQFLVPRAAERLDIPVAFSSYPHVAPGGARA